MRTFTFLIEIGSITDEKLGQQLGKPAAQVTEIDAKAYADNLKTNLAESNDGSEVLANADVAVSTDAR
jgi:hypothetical protein